MRALRLHGTGDVRVEDVPEPPGPGPLEVLVAPVVGGICGTDLHFYRNAPPLRSPQILCHEFAGEVMAVGSDVSQVRVGDRVAVMPIGSCGRCQNCRRGRGEMCEGHQTVGIRHPWGGFAELALVEDYQVTTIPESMTWEQAALVEPASVAATGVAAADVRSGDRVLVLGGGPVGALAALGAQSVGAVDVVISEPAPQRAKRLRELGFDVVDPAVVDVVEVCLERSGGVGFDAAIDCAGVPAAFASALSAVRAGGTVSVTAVYQHHAEIDLVRVLSRSLTIRGGLAYPIASWPRMLAKIASGRLPVERVVTGRVPLDDATAAFERLLAPDTADVKLLLDVATDRRPD